MFLFCSYGGNSPVKVKTPMEPAEKDPSATPAKPKLRSKVEPDMEADTDATIAAFGGNPREAVKALLKDNAALQSELDFASLAMSYGFTRGWSARLREG